jgi:cation-transporting P-type ATPase 13A2
VGQRVKWTSVDDDDLLLDEYSLRPLVLPYHYSAEADGQGSHDFTLAVTGEVFRWILNNAPIETIHNVSV